MVVAYIESRAALGRARLAKPPLPLRVDRRLDRHEVAGDGDLAVDDRERRLRSVRLVEQGQRRAAVRLLSSSWRRLGRSRVEPGLRGHRVRDRQQRRAPERAIAAAGRPSSRRRRRQRAERDRQLAAEPRLDVGRVGLGAVVAFLTRSSRTWSSLLSRAPGRRSPGNCERNLPTALALVAGQVEPDLGVDTRLVRDVAEDGRVGRPAGDDRRDGSRRAR